MYLLRGIEGLLDVFRRKLRIMDGLAVKISWTNPTLKKARIYNYFEEAESIDK